VNLVIFDLDGTLARLSHRIAIAGNEPPRTDPAEYQRWLDLLQPPGALLSDPPIEQTVWLARTLRPFCHMVYLTGRAEMHRADTLKWMARHGLPEAPLIMRQNDDYRTAAEYKEFELVELKRHFTGPITVIDDDGAQDCSAIYLKHGALHLMVKGE
jgi:phosphoglycolate phosphatase-like HAD superfamily hydrolase